MGTKFKHAVGYENKETRELKEKEFYAEQLSKRTNKSSKEIDKLADTYLDIGDIYRESAEKGKLMNRIDNIRKAKQNYSQALKYANNKQEKKILESLNYINEKEIKSFFRRSGLEKKSLYATLSIISLLAALFFVSSSFTGYAVLGLMNDNLKWIGLCFFSCGLILAFIHFSRKNIYKKK